MRLLAIAAVGLLAGCDLGPGDDMTPSPDPAVAAKQGPLEANGPGQSVQPAAGGDTLQWAASVVQVTPIEPADAKLFGLAGGDPAANGLQTYLAFFISPAEGWRVFQIGDFAAYRVLMEQVGRLDLEVDEDVAGDDGAISQRRRRMIVTFQRGPDGAAPDSITVTPAA